LLRGIPVVLVWGEQVVEAKQFINTKAFQLSNYADAMVTGLIPATEVNLYCWDTIEEWSQIRTSDLKMTPMESAFWYLLHQITFWNPTEIRDCPELQFEVNSCIDYLRGDGTYPEFISAVRP
jgi:hypothetical protein